MPTPLKPSHRPPANPYVPKREPFAWETPGWSSLRWYQQGGIVLFVTVHVGLWARGLGYLLGG